MRSYDVCIVGAGPSGLSTAIASSRLGVETAVFEEHREVGTSSAECGGLVSLRCLELLKLRVDGDYVVNRVYKAVIHSPADTSLTTSLGPRGALILDRRSFEENLASKALHAGADLYTGVRVRRIRVGRSYVELDVDGECYRCRAVVDAGGALSRFTLENLGFNLRLKRLIPAAQAEVEVEYEDDSSVHVFLGRKVAPGFFGWLIPLGSGRARVGVACEDGNPKRFLRKLLSRVGASRVYEEATRFILTGGPLPRTFGHRFLSVGDAAGQSKPTTGGGIFTGMLCGLIAGLTLAKATRRNSYSTHILSMYEKSWRNVLGRELKFQLLYRRLFRRLRDEALNTIVSTLSDRRVEGLRDFDYHSKTVNRLVLELGLRCIKPSVLQSLLKSLILGL
ncbi:NAD(P)/FAD-dependent oxidoreductase [Candidatus Bathyarchaeota archaeon]|nr:NAD(P)/FAD-dependent oxidoreductase [Candidatus Bathyarchaeota archaeon]